VEERVEGVATSTSRHGSDATLDQGVNRRGSVSRADERLHDAGDEDAADLVVVDTAHACRQVEAVGDGSGGCLNRRHAGSVRDVDSSRVRAVKNDIGKERGGRASAHRVKVCLRIAVAREVDHGDVDHATESTAADESTPVGSSHDRCSGSSRRRRDVARSERAGADDAKRWMLKKDWS
jgi:hypothetical protein